MGATAADELDALLTRLKLTAIRDRLDSLLDEAGRGEMSLREALAFLCRREIARKDQRRIDMSFGLAKFPFVRDLAGFEFNAQPSIGKAQLRDPATGARHRQRRRAAAAGPAWRRQSPGIHRGPGPMPRGRRRRL